MSFCIVCGSELEAGRCPACGWRLEPEATVAAPVGSVAAPAYPAGVIRSAPPIVTRHVTSRFLDALSPLVDFALHPDGYTYALSEAIGGRAASLARWGDAGFESSAMLAVGAPIGLELLDDGSPIVIGGKGVVVNVVFGGSASTEAVPVTRGHRTGWDVSCFAISPARTTLALGVPSDASVKGLATGDFGERVLLDGLPGNPTALAFADDGRQLGVGCYTGEIRVLDMSTHRTATFGRPGSAEGVVALAAVPGGGWVAAYEDSHILGWDPSGRVVAEDGLDADISTLAVDAITGQIAAGSSEGHVWAWEPRLEGRLAAQRVHAERVIRVVPMLGRGLTVSAARTGDLMVMELR